MHELAVCQALIDQLTDLARKHGATRVERVTLQIGPLSGVEPDLLANAFPIASAGTVADGAQLDVEAAPLRVWCDTCKTESSAEINRLTCANCGNWRTELRSGDELLLRSVVLEDAEPARAARQPEEENHV